MDFNDDSYEIIGAAMEVHTEMGPGLREKPYENALVIALRERGFRVEPQKPYPIHFKQHIVGDCRDASAKRSRALAMFSWLLA